MLVEEYRMIAGISLRELKRIWKRVGKLAVLVGGWASHLWVDPEFYRWKRLHYVGSKDIDVGLRREDAPRVMKELERMGYTRSAFRFYKIFDRESGAPVSQVEARKRPLYELFYVYLDPVLDGRIDGETLLWDPLLNFCLGNELTEVREGFSVLRPEPLVLMKLRHMPERNPEKRVKDMMDVLLTVGLAEFDARLFSEFSDLYRWDKRAVSRCINVADEELLALGLAPDEIRNLKVTLGSVLKL